MANAKLAFQNAVTVVLVICALLVTASVVRREFFQSEGVEQIREISGWRSIAADRQPYFGSSNAPVQILVFSDYQCPFCKDLDGKLNQLASEKNVQFALRRYEFPLTKAHPYAYRAALAAKCSEEQGVSLKFQQELFDRSDKLGELNFEQAAHDAGVPNSQEFLRCIAERRTAGALRKDADIADKLGITGVPVFIINGEMYTGTRAISQLRQLITTSGRKG